MIDWGERFVSEAYPRVPEPSAVLCSYEHRYPTTGHSTWLLEPAETGCFSVDGSRIRRGRL